MHIYIHLHIYTIQLRALRKVGCHDSRHMRAVRASVADDREALALFVDGHAVVKQQRHFLAARHGLDGAGRFSKVSSTFMVRSNLSSELTAEDFYLCRSSLL